MIDRFKAASPARQILLAIVAAVVVGGMLALLWFLVLRAPYEPLFTRMRSLDAATIVAELDKRKIPYRLADHGATVLVPADMVDATRLAVMSEDLPIKGSVGFELFNKSDMGLTDFAQKINYQRALQGELARTIMSLDGVESARVHLSLGEDRIFRDDRVPPKASVTIRMKDAIILSIRAAQGVQRLVAASVPQLAAGDVVILDEAGDVISSASAAQYPPTDQPATPFLREKAAIEQYYAARVGEALQKLRVNDIRVTVRADIVVPGPGEEAPQWTPDARNFGLHVTLASQGAVEPQSVADIKAAAAGAIALDAALGDDIAFTRTQWPEDGPLVDPTRDTLPSRSRPDPVLAPTTAPESGNKWAQWGLSLIALLAIGGLALLSRRRSGRLTPQQHRAFAARLNAALDKRDARATSGI